MQCSIYTYFHQCCRLTVIQKLKTIRNTHRIKIKFLHIYELEYFEVHKDDLMAWGHVHNIRSWGKMSGKDLYICGCLCVYRHAKEKFEIYVTIQLVVIFMVMDYKISIIFSAHTSVY